MKLITPKVIILNQVEQNDVISILANIARTCYKSEDRSNEDSDKALIQRIIESKHDAILEFFDITVKFTCSRAISHELVRHRLASYAQESQRYCNYSKIKFNNEIQFIKPAWFTIGSTESYDFTKACEQSEQNYFRLLGQGLKPQDARDVLINAVKTEINMKANLREWRHFLKLRCSTAAHPEMRLLALDLLGQLHNKLPLIFDDIYAEYNK